MKLAGRRLADSVGDPAARRNVTLGVVKHLWRSAVPFVGFYPPEGVRVTENRIYTPAPPRLVDDTDYLLGVEEHKRAFAKDLRNSMLPAGNLPGYFEVPTDEGWRIEVDRIERGLILTDAWGLETSSTVVGDLAPFVWAYRHCGFCIVTVYDRDIDALRDDLLFVAKREGVVLRWGEKAA